jgi:SAM-dependent methyltransferase
MSEPFGPGYAGAYDLIYREKNYEAECDLLERVFRSAKDRIVRRVLDLGCGTGRHSEILARRGYEVSGVDVSPDMLARARARTSALPRPPRFHLGDVQNVRLSERFDAVLLLFAVLGYQTTNEAVVRALAVARAHLEPGGILFFDVWHGPAVLTTRPERRVLRIPSPEGEIVREATAELDVRHHLCTVRYRLARTGSEPEVEVHRMRFFFPMEIEALLAAAGFEMVRFGAFPDIDRDPDDDTWNVAVLARAGS